MPLERKKSFITEPSTASPRSPKMKDPKPSSRVPDQTSSEVWELPLSSSCTTNSKKSSELNPSLELEEHDFPFKNI